MGFDWENNSLWPSERERVENLIVSLSSEQWDLRNLAEDYLALREAVQEVYYAAHWTPDRPCGAIALWGHLRDAARLEPGHSPKFLEGTNIDQLARAVADAAIMFREHRCGREPFKAAIEAYKKAVETATEEAKK